MKTSEMLQLEKIVINKGACVRNCVECPTNMIVFCAQYQPDIDLLARKNLALILLKGRKNEKDVR